MNEKLFKVISSLIVSLILFTASGCLDTYHDHPLGPIGLGSYDEIRHYTFDPYTVFVGLGQGQEGIFQPIQGYVEDNVYSSGSFSWSQQDYLEIANALNRAAAKDTLESWNLFAMDFTKECNDNPIGFDTVQITYFRENGSQYIAREIDVFPLKREADWGGDTNFPRPFPFGWRSVNLAKHKITADDALQIAESNGGRNARLEAKNNCRILVNIPDADNDNWLVMYYTGAFTKFYINVDPYTGEYKVLAPSN
jgi:hypothetical protein